jgi:hypothetical protein
MEKNELKKLGMPKIKELLVEAYGVQQSKEILNGMKASNVTGRNLRNTLIDYIMGKTHETENNQKETVSPTLDYGTPKSQIEYVKDTFDEYLGKKTHISASDIKNFLHSPRYYFYKTFEEVKEQNNETERHFPIGSAVHEVILEPELFKSNYVIAPKFDMRTNVGKMAYAKFREESRGKTILFENEFTMAVKMGESASQNDTFVGLINDSYRELSCYTHDEKTGLLIRMRPDSFAKNKNTITDIKTCQDSSPSKFKYDVRKFGYPITAAFYMDFLKRENYVFCAIEKQAPHETALYMLDDEMIDWGRKQYRMGLDLLKWSIDNKYWCSYNEFEILKECYELGNLDEFFEIKSASEKITILR